MLLKEEGNDLAYWLSGPPVERLRALDSLRRMYIKANVAPGEQRLQRVCRIVKLKLTQTAGEQEGRSVVWPEIA